MTDRCEARVLTVDRVYRACGTPAKGERREPTGGVPLPVCGIHLRKRYVIAFDPMKPSGELDDEEVNWGDS